MLPYQFVRNYTLDYSFLPSTKLMVLGLCFRLYCSKFLMATFMNILVTGGLGFIGSHTCVKLIEDGYTPIIIDNLSNSKMSVLGRIEKITNHRPIFYHGDIRDANLLEQIMQKHQIYSVIHFAGLKAVGESSQIPLEYYENNVFGSIVLAKTMQKNQIFNLIFSSSATVYGDQPILPFTESMPTGRTTSPYGTSKLMVEQIYSDLFNSNTRWNIALLRYFNPIGAHPSGLIGEDPKGIPNNLVPYVTQVAIGKRQSVSVYGNDYPTHDGTGVRDYIHVEDLALGHLAALNKCKKEGVHIYNLGSGLGSSVLDVIHAFESACEKEIPYTLVARRSGDIAEFYADPQKAKQQLDWETEKSLMDMAIDSWRWQSNNPNGYPDK